MSSTGASSTRSSTATAGASAKRSGRSEKRNDPLELPHSFQPAFAPPERMNPADLHAEMTVFDGLVIANFGREVFEDMHRGGLTAANCTCSIWEGFRDTMNNVSRWKRWFAENSDLITQVYT